MQSALLNQIIILTLMMAIGFVLRKRGILTNPVNKAMSWLLINVTMPCLILYSFNFKFSADMLSNSLWIMVYSAVIIVGTAVVAHIIYCRMERTKRVAYIFATVFSNCGFVGYPVAQGLFGNIGVFYTSMFTVPFNILMWTYGIMLFTGEKDFKKLGRSVINMPNISILLGFIMFLTSFQLPKPVLGTFSGVGNMTTPISMFVIGSMLADVRLRQVFSGLDLYFATVVKLLIIPVLSIFAMKAMGANVLLTQICVLMTALPSGAMVGIFAQQYNGNAMVASRIVFITTILSVITIPLVFSWS